MRWSLLFLTVVACGDNAPAPPDAAPDAGPPDPFAGMFDEPKRPVLGRRSGRSRVGGEQDLGHVAAGGWAARVAVAESEG